MEAEIIPMCENQGMAIVPWAALGGGQLLSVEQRKIQEKTPGARKGYSQSESDLKVCEVLEKIAETQETTLQAVVCLYTDLSPSAHDSLTNHLRDPRLWHTSSSSRPSSFL